MKKSFAFYLKTAFLLIGTILIISAGFSPVQSQLVFNGPEFSDTVDVVQNGIHHLLWYVLLFLTGIIFSIGYFYNKTVNRVLLYVFIPVFAVVFLFFSVLSIMTWGATPFVPHLEYGYELMCYGSILVITATLISVHRKTKSKATISNSDLLDN